MSNPVLSQAFHLSLGSGNLHGPFFIGGSSSHLHAVLDVSHSILFVQTETRDKILNDDISCLSFLASPLNDWKRKAKITGFVIASYTCDMYVLNHKINKRFCFMFLCELFLISTQHIFMWTFPLRPSDMMITV